MNYLDWLKEKNRRVDLLKAAYAAAIEAGHDNEHIEFLSLLVEKELQEEWTDGKQQESKK